jgi:hypothetical protein
MSASQELECAMKRLRNDEGRSAEEEKMHTFSSEGLLLRDEAGAQAAHISWLGTCFTALALRRWRILLSPAYHNSLSMNISINFL